MAIVEASVYDNPAFLRQLKDAAASLKVGGSWEVNSVVTPLIREPEGNLLRALTQLEPGEEWLLKPEPSEDNPCLWSPGIRLGVKPGSWFHQTECFGPVLGIIRAENLEEAIDIQNDSEFGLTGGLQSLDEREIALWKLKCRWATRTSTVSSPAPLSAASRSAGGTIPPWGLEPRPEVPTTLPCWEVGRKRHCLRSCARRVNVSPDWWKNCVPSCRTAPSASVPRPVPRPSGGWRNSAWIMIPPVFTEKIISSAIPR